MSLLILLAIPEVLVLGIGATVYVTSLFKKQAPVDWVALDGWNR